MILFNNRANTSLPLTDISTQELVPEFWAAYHESGRLRIWYEQIEIFCYIQWLESSVVFAFNTDFNDKICLFLLKLKALEVDTLY